MIKIKYVIVSLIVSLNIMNLGMFYEMDNDYNDTLVLDDCLENTYEVLEKVEEHLNILKRLPTGVPCKGYVSSGFGYRSIPYAEGTQFHKGVDIVGDNGDNIYSTGRGIVMFADKQGGYGNLIIIDHQNGYHTYYAHLSKIIVVKNQKVEKNDLIGQMGQTGTTTGNHLHYEIKYKQKHIDPIVYMQK